MKYVVSVFAVLCMMAATTAPSFAHEEKAEGNQLLVDVNTGSVTGAALLYAVTSTIQLGGGLGVQIEENRNAFYFSPQARFLFLVLASTYLYIDAQFRLLFGDIEGSALAFSVGLQSWVSSAVAVYGGVGVLNLGFDPSRTTLGLLSAVVGLQFAML